MNVDMMNFFRVRKQDGHDIVLVDRIPTVLTREEALDLAIWLVVSADSTADSGDSEFAVMLREAESLRICKRPQDRRSDHGR